MTTPTNSHKAWTDKGGHVSSSGFELWALESATTPQVTNLLPPVLVLSRDTGSVAHVTRNGRIQISGLQDAASWHYRIRTDGLWDHWIDGTESVLTLAADANYRVVARQVDAVGNCSANSYELDFTLDTTPPDPLISRLGLSSPTGFQITAADNGRTLSGSGTDRNADVLIFHGDRRLLAIRSNHRGVFSHTFTAAEIERIGQGTQSFTVRQVDRAGNRAESSTKTAFVNTTTGSDRLDILTGVRASRDVFAWESLEDSLLRRFDTITNYESHDSIRIGINRGLSIIYSSSGRVNELTSPEINVVLGGRNFSADTVAAFRQRGVNGTYLVINDSQPGFQTASDALIFLAGFNVNDRSNQIAVL